MAMGRKTIFGSTPQGISDEGGFGGTVRQPISEGLGFQNGFVLQTNPFLFGVILTRKSFCISHLETFWARPKLALFCKNALLRPGQHLRVARSCDWVRLGLTGFDWV
jgi:hypothetical protein